MSLNCLKQIPPVLKLLSECGVLKSNNCLLLNKPCLIYSSTNNLIRFLTSKNSETQTEIVYYGTLSSQIKSVKIFSLMSSAIGIAIQPFLYNELMSLENLPVIVTAYAFVGFFTFVTPVLLHLISKKYITQLYYKPNTDTYVANTFNFFCFKKQTEFKPDDVVVPDIPGMFTTFHTNGKPFFLDPRFFENPAHYARIMGFDKPVDFKLHETCPNTKNKQ